MKLILDTEARTLTLDDAGNQRTIDLYSTEAFEAISRQWVRVGWNQKYQYTFSWMGRPVIQLPDDMLRMQEVISKIKPDVIIETGVAHGGSLVFYASLCKAMDKGRVVGIDIEIRPHNRHAIEAHPLAGYITLIEGSSTAPEIVEQVRRQIRPGETTLIILDSNHTYAHVRDELAAYAELVTPGSYIVATDGIMFDLADVPRGSPGWRTDNPTDAARDFAAQRPEFIIEQPVWPFNESTLTHNITHWPGAWLRRLELTDKNDDPADRQHAESGDNPDSLDTPDAAQIELICTLFNQGRHQEVETLAQAMTQRFPEHGFGWKLLGLALQQQGRPGEAIGPYRKAVELDDEDIDALNNLGVAQYAAGQLADAESTLRLTVTRLPDSAIPLLHLGNVLKDQARGEEAEACFAAALVLKPGWNAVIANRGANLQNMGRLDAAEACYREALQQTPGNHRLWSNLGVIRNHKGDRADAAVCFRRALDIDPEVDETQNNLGVLLHASGDLTEAKQCFLHALTINPRLAEARGNLSLTLAYMSSFEDVVAHSDAALALAPDLDRTWETRLYALSYHPDLSAAQIYAEFARWGARYPQPVPDFAAHDRTPGRRLRVGYVSPDFRRHTSRFYFLPLFANHDPATVELFAYSNVRVDDQFTEQFKALFHHWRPIRHLADAEAAQLVRDDRIDILVDCCNHMEANRLGVFTRKPAPIQVTWLGAAWTTGLTSIDYVLSDPIMAPPDTLTSETIVRLPHFFVAFQPPEETAEIAPPPCLQNGWITFGYSGRTERLNHRTFRVWGEILRRLPQARLILDYRIFATSAMQAYYKELMRSHGVDVSRVQMRCSDNIFQGLNDVDILLDCFPHSGGTMLFDALWMGVPALTLAGRPPVGLIGTSLMTNLGLPEWVAVSENDYIDKACAFAAQPATLSTLRSGMRARMWGSPVMDGAGFARGVESAYRQMYLKWTQQCG